MKRMFTLPLFTMTFMLVSVALKAQIYYNFETATPTSNSYSNINADTVRQGNNNGTTQVRNSTSASTSDYTGASGGNNAGAAARTGGFDPATSTYFELTLTPTEGNSVVLTGVSFGSRSTSTGPQAASVRTSVDAFATDKATFTLNTDNDYTLYGQNLNVTGIAGTPVIIRIYGFNGTGNANMNTANWRIDDLTINPAIVFPLNLVSFRGSLNSNSAVQLAWNTANEQNVNEYSLERSSDGTSFTGITNIPAINRSEASYTFTDSKPLSGTNYYRLKMSGKDGTIKYSNVVAINNSRGISASVFPNPVVSSLSITHSRATKGALLKILNAEGRQLKLYNVEVGAVQTSLGVNELLTGTYVLVFENNGERIITRFVKQ